MKKILIGLITVLAVSTSTYAGESKEFLLTLKMPFLQVITCKNPHIQDDEFKTDINFGLNAQNVNSRLMYITTKPIFGFGASVTDWLRLMLDFSLWYSSPEDGQDSLYFLLGGGLRFEPFSSEKGIFYAGAKVDYELIYLRDTDVAAGTVALLAESGFDFLISNNFGAGINLEVGYETKANGEIDHFSQFHAIKALLNFTIDYYF